MHLHHQVCRIRNDIILLANKNPTAWAWFADRRGEELLWRFMEVEFLKQIREEIFYIIHNDGADEVVLGLFVATKLRLLVEDIHVR